MAATTMVTTDTMVEATRGCTTEEGMVTAHGEIGTTTTHVLMEDSVILVGADMEDITLTTHITTNFIIVAMVTAVDIRWATPAGVEDSHIH